MESRKCGEQMRRILLRGRSKLCKKWYGKVRTAAVLFKDLAQMYHVKRLLFLKVRPCEETKRREMPFYGKSGKKESLKNQIRSADFECASK